MTVRVLVVDDHPAFRKALTSALSMVEGWYSVNAPSLDCPSFGCRG